MRLNRLDLIRYGRFKDAQIAFPKPAEGQPDVTIVFGPNEAGKSTAFNGFLELLFGFKSGAHPYAFRFERSDLMVGAELDLPGRGPTVLRRNSKRTQSLCDANDRPLNEAILSGALHGLTRDAYEERFSLNDKGLREGGERIAGAQGDLGQLLHAGLSGLTGIADTLDALADRADKFHKKRGRGTVLKTATDRLKEIGRDLRADRLTTERERSLRQARERASATFEASDLAYRKATQRQTASKAAQLWYDKTEEIARLTQALADLPDGPDVAAGAAERVAKLVEKTAAQNLRIAETAEDIAKQDQILADHPLDGLAEPLAAELDRLDHLHIDGAPLLGRASTAQADLTRRREDLATLSQQIDAVLAQLNAPDVPASALALDDSDLEALATAVQACLTADLSAQAAQEALDAARTQHGDAPSEPQDFSALRRAFDHWSAVADPSLRDAEHRQASARLSKTAAGLPETWQALVAAGLPARETLDEVARTWTDLTAELASARKELEARATELAEAQAAFAAHEAAPDAVDVAKTEETRRQRDTLWRRHRDTLSPESADQFAAAMHVDDDLRAHYLTGAEARQHLRTAQTQLSIAGARQETAKARYDTVTAQLDALTERCASLARALGLDADTTPAAFSVRHQTLSAASEAAADLANAEDARKAQTAQRDAAHAALRIAAQAVGLDPTLGDVSARVQRALALEETDRKAWAKWKEGAKTLAAMDRKSEQARSARKTAHAKLDQLTAALPLPDTTLNAIHTALPNLRSLHNLHDNHQKLSMRIAALEHAIAAMAESAGRLAQIMGNVEEEAGADPIRIIDAARARVTQAVWAAEKRSDAMLRREDCERIKRNAEAELQTARDDLAICFDGQGGDGLTPRDRIALLVERDGLRVQISSADRERQKVRAGVQGDLFDEELSRMPDSTRAPELEQALQDAQSARDTARDEYRDAERLYREAFDAVDRSDLATEQATLLEELRNGARQAAVARLGVLAARGALRRLAAERRSGMLRDVEKAFVTMTAPAWSGVDVWSQAEGEKLVGIQPDGSTVPVEQMSTGTMGQLYFALRLAGYRSFARAPGPLPMILDDIMETFDDTRARAALQLCAEIGANGQAILFTHHAHLVTLARESIDGVAIVPMPD